MQPFFTLKNLNQKARRIQAGTGCKLADAKDQATREVTGLKDYDQLFRARLTLYQPTGGQAVPAAVAADLTATDTAFPAIPAIATVSDNGWDPVEFNAGKWLAEAPDADLQELADFGFCPEMGLPYRIAESALNDSTDMSALFDYRDSADDGMFEQVDIRVEFSDVDAARRWVQTSRPQIRLLPVEADKD